MSIANERTREQIMETQGHKDDSDKPSWDSLPAEALFEVVEVFTHGMKKYNQFNWRKGMNWSRLFRAAVGHIYSWIMGERNDPESGKHHLAHAVCCCLMLLDMEKRGIGTDNRTVINGGAHEGSIDTPDPRPTQDAGDGHPSTTVPSAG